MTQLNKNLISNIINLIVNVFIGLLYTPYLVRSLGIVAYGIIPLALILNQYIGIVTTSLTTSLTRFYSISLQDKKYKNASEYLSSTFFALIIISILLVPLIFLLVENIDEIFNINAVFLQSAKWLFALTIFSFIVSLYSSFLNITLYALNRLDLMNVIKIVRSGLKVLLAFLFFQYIQTDIKYIGYSNLLTELLIFVLSFFFYLKTVKRNVILSFSYFSKVAIISILSMSSWIVIHALGDTALYRIDTFLVNKFWTTRESGILGALSEFGIYINSVISVIASLFGPLILIAYSKGEHEKVKSLALSNSLYIGIITALIVGILMGFSKPIVGLWLGDEFSDYNMWLILKIIVLPFQVSASIFAFVNKAWGYVMYPAIITLLIGVLNFLLLYWLCDNYSSSENTVVYILMVSSFFIIFQSYIFQSYFCFCRLYKKSGKAVTFILLKILMTMLVSFCLSISISSYMQINTIVELILFVLGSGLICILGVFFAILTSIQRKEILKYVGLSY